MTIKTQLEKTVYDACSAASVFIILNNELNV